MDQRKISTAEVEAEERLFVQCLQFICTGLAVASFAAGVFAGANALGNIFPTLGQKISPEYLLLKPPNDIWASGCCLIGGVFILLLGVTFLVYGWTPHVDYRENKHPFQASLRMLTGKLLFGLPGVMLVLLGIYVCVTGKFYGLGIIFMGVISLTFVPMIEP